MTEKLKDYQVLDVLCGGTFYKVRHKVTNNIFAWKAYDCSAYSDEQIQNVVNEVKTISKVQSEVLLRYYSTILHSPSKTLYFVLEYNCWRSLEELLAASAAAGKLIAESFIWYLLLELARVCKAVEGLCFVVLRKCIAPAAIFVGEGCELRVNCLELATGSARVPDVMRQVGDVVHMLCYRRGAADHKTKEFHYSDDLRDVVGFLTDDRNANMRPDVVLYHPTVLANLETLAGPKHLSEILVHLPNCPLTSEVNKCDSEKAVGLYRAVEPVPRTHLNPADSPIYSNISPKKQMNKEIELNSTRGSLSPTLAALALELPGFVPRSRKPFSQALQSYKPQQVSEETLSQQWMSRLVALRHREESLNQRERDLIAKKIVNSPTTKFIPLHGSPDIECGRESNGITLPPMMPAAEVRNEWVSRRRHRRSSSGRLRNRRKTFAYEDLDSSLSADAGDESVIITATKFTKDNMPRRSIFPDVASKKVHFTSSNPFAESDESVTLTFYELGNVDADGYQLPRQDKVVKDITKFKYLDLEKLTSEKRAAMQQWSHSSPSKQAKFTKKIFSDITNTDEGMRKTPSKASLTSKGSNSSRFSMASGKSQCSIDSSASKPGGGSVSDRTRSRDAFPNTPVAPPEVKKSKRKSLLPFKTPFKFMTATKI